MDLVDSVTVENETYTYTLNKEALSRVFDSYGTFSASYARLEASFNGEDLKDLDLSVKGTAALDAQSAPISLAVSLEIESMNQDVSISYPADLESWPVQ